MQRAGCHARAARVPRGSQDLQLAWPQSGCGGRMSGMWGPQGRDERKVLRLLERDPQPLGVIVDLMSL